MAEQRSSNDQAADRQGIGYGRVFLILALITAVEVGLGSTGLTRPVRNTLFLLFSLAKASLVAAYYMHLRRDSRLYTYIFIAPAILLLVFALVAAVP